MHSVNFAAKLVHTDVPFPVLLSTLIRSQFQAKPATFLIPIDFSFLFAVEELYGTRYQSGSFSLMVTMGGDLQLGCLADRLLTGLGQPQINP